MRFTVLSIFIVILAACLPDNSDKPVVFETSSVEILRQNDLPLVLNVEMADTDAKRARGLMYRASLPLDNGMLFDFPGYRQISMWMANTSVSLDMFFIDKDGTVTEIAENTVPLSREQIKSSAKTKAVLEMNAGSAKRLNIRPGDKIKHLIFALEK